MVYDSNQKDYIQEKLNLFALLGACLGFQLPIPDCAMSKGWGGSYAQSPCTKLSEGPWRHPRGRGHVGIRGTRGRWVQSQHQSRARASTHGCEHSRLAPAPPINLGRGEAMVVSLVYCTPHCNAAVDGILVSPVSGHFLIQLQSASLPRYLWRHRGCECLGGGLYP